MKFLKPFFLIYVIFFSSTATAQSLGGFGSYESTTQSMLTTITNQLGIQDSGNSFKEDTYNSLSFALDGTWHFYWIGLNDLAKSKYVNGAEKGFIQVLLSTVDATYIVTFAKNKDIAQVIVSIAQVRHGSQDNAITAFRGKKGDSETYDVETENDNYAFIKEKGKISFSMFNVGPDTGSVTYFDQIFIDI